MLFPFSLSAICNTTSQHSFYITDLQRGEYYVLWMTALTDAGESPWGNSELVCLESKEPAGGEGPTEPCVWSLLLLCCPGAAETNLCPVSVGGSVLEGQQSRILDYGLPISRGSCRHSNIIKYCLLKCHCFIQFPDLKPEHFWYSLQVRSGILYECCPD